MSALTCISYYVGVYIVGGTPYADILRRMEDLSLTNVHFVDFKEPYVLKRWNRAADLFCRPVKIFGAGHKRIDGARTSYSENRSVYCRGRIT